ncbi:MAG: hypothetical protein ABI432_04795 [Flavobacteriales bacterium]
MNIERTLSGNDAVQRMVMSMVKHYKSELIKRIDHRGRTGSVDLTTTFKGYELKLRHDTETPGKLTVLQATPIAEQPVWS